jgi:putative sugar O-methyltransferase
MAKLKTEYHMASWMWKPIRFLLKEIYKVIGFHGLLVCTSLYSVPMYFFKYRKYKAVSLVHKGFVDHGSGIALIDKKYKSIFLRLAEAYVKAKQDQLKVVPPYTISHLWQDNLDKYFVDLVGAICNKDTIHMKKLLENVGRDFGFGGEYDSHEIKKNFLYKYQFINTWYKCYEIFQQYAGKESELTYSQVGNPAGLYHNGQTIPLDAIRLHYHAKQILSLLRDVQHPVICEIGAGVGGQAYTILSNSERAITYIIFDIPEVLITASYFLMANFPERKIMLYKEGSLSRAKLEQYDIILMPYFALPQLGNNAVDLFFNSASFGEMESDMAEEYISQIERICRKYLMHINHTANWQWGETHSSLSTELIPSPRLFKKIYQYSELLYLAREEDKILYKYLFRSMYYAFLYERLKMN